MSYSYNNYSEAIEELKADLENKTKELDDLKKQQENNVSISSFTFLSLQILEYGIQMNTNVNDEHVY